MASGLASATAEDSQPVIVQQADVDYDTGTPFALLLKGIDPGRSGALTWSATGLPEGVHMHPAGMLFGSADEFGSFPIVVTASVSGGVPSTMAFEMTVLASPPLGL